MHAGASSEVGERHQGLEGRKECLGFKLEKRVWALQLHIDETPGGEGEGEAAKAQRPWTVSRARAEQLKDPFSTAGSTDR